MLPTLETVRRAYPKPDYTQDYLVESLVRIHAYTHHIDVNGRAVAALGTGAGVEAAYMLARGAQMTAVDSEVYAYDPRFKPIQELFSGTDYVQHGIQHWISDVPDETFDLLFAFNAVAAFMSELNTALFEQNQTTFPQELHRILRPGGVFLFSGDYPPDLKEMHPLVATRVLPDYEGIKDEISLIPELADRYWFLTTFEYYKYLRAEKV